MADENPQGKIDTVKWLEEQIAKGRNPLDAQKEAIEIATKQLLEQTKQEAAERQIGQKLDMLNLLTAFNLMNRNS